MYSNTIRSFMSVHGDTCLRSQLSGDLDARNQGVDSGYYTRKRHADEPTKPIQYVRALSTREMADMMLDEKHRVVD